MGKLGYDVVIATRNRPDALKLSLPLLLHQSEPPKSIIIVDSSDDHSNVAKLVRTITDSFRVNVIIRRSERGLTLQRNIGLSEVNSEVVFFPDDDALFLPNAAREVMRIYEYDEERKVSAINPADSPFAPTGVLASAGYAMSYQHLAMARTVRSRTWLARRIHSLNPKYFIGDILLRRSQTLPWLREMDAIPVEWMTGYRMTFRTEVIKQFGFERAFSGYSLFEDVDASWAAWRSGVVVGANRAKVYHHKFPSPRSDNYSLGAMSILNLAFLMAKHSADLGLSKQEVLKSHRLTKSYATIRILSRVARASKQRNREELSGMKQALREVDSLFYAPRNELVATYVTAKDKLGIN